MMSCGHAQAPASTSVAGGDPASFARYTYDVIRANDTQRYSGDVMMPFPVCMTFAGQAVRGRSSEAVCEEYARNSSHSFTQIHTIAAGPLMVHSVWSKTSRGPIITVMVETTFADPTGQQQAMKVEVLPWAGRFYLFSLHTTPMSCLGRTACE